MKLRKLLFLNDYRNQVLDGLTAALELLQSDFQITQINLLKESIIDPENFDFILGHGGFNSPVDIALSKIPDAKKGLCIGGNAFPYHEGYDVYFYETEWVKNYLKLPKNSIHAFGINSDIFNEINIPTPIIWDYLGVGSFSAWKRWEKMTDKQGSRLVIGEYQKDNEQESGSIVLDLIKNGVMVSGMTNPYDLANLYHWSRTLYIPADVMGGGERSILEARACGLKVEIEDDNPKLKELLTSPIWDEKYYASKLKEGILGCL